MSILLSQASSDNGAFEFDLKGLGTLFEGLSGEEGEVAERAKGAMRKQVALEIRKEFPTSYGAVEEYFAVRDRVKEIQKLGKYLPEWTNEFRQQLPPFLEAYPPKYIDKDTPAYMARRDVREHWDPLQRFAPLSLKGKLSGGGGDIDGDIWYAYGDILLADFALVNARTHQMIIYNLLSLPTVHPIGPIVHVGAMDDGKTFHIAAGGPLQVSE
uniref:Uncharacterized protein n=1 Tax=Chromera velia CCMP2878 TaxID=1169474 RepID=A0A0G4IDW5_9ALVE|eukprot:Cvel_13414.t1-p1 / transcript=Cvel_13414.t1 / gene=Cvel_13414 / organism=Chromera_velia_CCMP2878 / gene_product=hypothetical protein / transcript_product=hypothetical protein / location=Cvel_scaffold914:51386-52371(-) / protein_length=212 / sequence_SO=supercontig / SO=protein_coding / is_pseudo=false